MRRISLPAVNAQTARLLQFNALYSIAIFGVIDVLLNFYFVSLGYTDETIGLLQSLPRIGGLLAAVVVVPVTARMGARSVLIWTTLGMALTQALVVLVPTVAAIAVSRAALGLVFGIQQIAINPVVVALARPEHRTRMFGYISMTANVAGSAGGFVGGFLPGWIAFALPALAVHADLPAAQTPFAYGGAIILASLTTVLAVLPLLGMEIPQISLGAAASDGASARIPWRVLLPRGIPMLFFGITGGLTFPFYNLFFRGAYGVSDVTVGTVLSFGYLIMAFPVLLGPEIERRWGRSRGLIISTLVSGAAFFALSLTPSLEFAIVWFVVAISLRNIVNGIYPPILLDGLPAHMHSAASSLGFLAWNVGWLISTSASGFLMSGIGFPAILQISGVGVVLIGVSAWLVQRYALRQRGSLMPEPADLPTMPAES